MDYLTKYRFIAQDNANPFDSLGEVQVNSGHYNEGIENLNHALAIKPDFIESIGHIAVAYEGLGEYGKAMKQYERAAELSDSSYMRREYLERAMRKRYYAKDAEGLVRLLKAVQRFPATPKKKCTPSSTSGSATPSWIWPRTAGAGRAPPPRARARARRDRPHREAARSLKPHFPQWNAMMLSRAAGTGQDRRGAHVLAEERESAQRLRKLRAAPVDHGGAGPCRRDPGAPRGPRQSREADRREPQVERELGPDAGVGSRRGRAAAREGAGRLQVMERSRHFETQHKLLLLETLYDAGLSLGAMPDEETLVEDVLSRVVGVLDASRGYVATFADGGARRAEARVGFPKRPAEAWSLRTSSSARSSTPSRRSRAKSSNFWDGRS